MHSLLFSTSAYKYGASCIGYISIYDECHVRCRDISEAIRVELFKRTADVLQANPFYCADFVQAGALETLIAQGTYNPIPCFQSVV